MKSKIKNFIYNFLFLLSNFSSIFLESILVGLLALFLVFKFLQLDLSNLSIPFHYDGDGLHLLAIIKSLLENNWYLFNGNLGAPFGLDNHDFPIPDGGMLLLIKIISWFCSDIYLIHNIIFLGGFFVVAAVSYTVLCRFGVIKIFSFSGAILFALIPFHFMRIFHLFYTWYFSIPIYIFLCIKIMADEDKNQPISWQDILFLVVCASFGLYYAFFASVLLFFSAIYSFQSMKYHQIQKALIFIGVIYATLAVNLSPNILHKIITPPNPDVTIRIPVEAELYALRMTQLVLPSPVHRINWLAEKTQKYNETTPLVNENVTATLGLIGSIGFVILLISVFMRKRTLFDIKILPQLANLNLASFLLGTIGGVGSLFALLVSPMIRGYNRISIFIAFLSITTVVLILQKIIIDRNFKNPNIVYIITTMLILFIGFFDQTSPAFIPNYIAIKQIYEHDARFIQKIEALVPGAMIYQLPYIKFPEWPPLYQESAYGLMRGYLHSKTLKWSYGAMRGREGDLWLKAMSALPIEEQVQKIAASGFEGIYIDRRAFNDHAVNLESQLKLLVPTAPIVSEGGNLAFYHIQPTGNKPVAMMMAMSPPLLGKGFYGWEGGAGKFIWSSGDAELWLTNPNKTPINAKLSFELNTLLPRKVLVNVGDDQKTIEKNLQPEEPQLVNINVKLKPGKTHVQFKTNTPAQLPGNGDPRKLAFSLHNISIERFFNGD